MLTANRLGKTLQEDAEEAMNDNPLYVDYMTDDRLEYMTNDIEGSITAIEDALARYEDACEEAFQCHKQWTEFTVAFIPPSKEGIQRTPNMPALDDGIVTVGEITEYLLNKDAYVRHALSIVKAFDNANKRSQQALDDIEVVFGKLGLPAGVRLEVGEYLVNFRSDERDEGESRLWISRWDGTNDINELPF